MVCDSPSIEAEPVVREAAQHLLQLGVLHQGVHGGLLELGNVRTREHAVLVLAVGLEAGLVPLDQGRVHTTHLG